MRITSGYLKGRVLKTAEGMNTRPTTDKVRQALFNMLRARTHWCGFNQAVVLDAFAGSGALGLEALSNGADHVSFFDKDYKAIKSIKDNISSFQCQEACIVKKNDVTQYDFGQDDLSYNLVFLDPPYGRGLAEKTLIHLCEMDVLSDNALILIEMDAGKEEQIPQAFTQVAERHYGRTCIRFYLYKK